MDTKNWLKFAETCKCDFCNCNFQDKLIEECGGSEDIAWVVFHHLGQGSIVWLHASVPALGRKKPSTLINAGRSDEVREVLWRFPC